MGPDLSRGVRGLGVAVSKGPVFADNPEKTPSKTEETRKHKASTKKKVFNSSSVLQPRRRLFPACVHTSKYIHTCTADELLSKED